MKCIVHDQTDWSYEAGKKEKERVVQMFKSIHSENKQFGTQSTKMAVHYEHFWFPKKRNCSIFDNILKVKDTTILIARFYFKCSRKPYRHQQLELFLKCVGIIFVNCKKKHHQT